jgi:hypothetical protein
MRAADRHGSQQLEGSEHKKLLTAKVAKKGREGREENPDGIAGRVVQSSIKNHQSSSR